MIAFLFSFYAATDDPWCFESDEMKFGIMRWLDIFDLLGQVRYVWWFV